MRLLTWMSSAQLTVGGRPERGRSSRRWGAWLAKRWTHLRRAEDVKCRVSETVWRRCPVTTSRTAWARRKTRASFVCLSTVSQVGRAGSGNWSCSVRIGVLFHINYYENYENAIVCPEIVRIPPYWSN